MAPRYGESWAERNWWVIFLIIVLVIGIVVVSLWAAGVFDKEEETSGFDLPAAPAGVSVVMRGACAEVTITPPSSTGGAEITNYTVRAVPADNPDDEFLEQKGGVVVQTEPLNRTDGIGALAFTEVLDVDPVTTLATYADTAGSRFRFMPVDPLRAGQQLRTGDAVFVVWASGRRVLAGTLGDRLRVADRGTSVTDAGAAADTWMLQGTGAFAANGTLVTSETTFRLASAAVNPTVFIGEGPTDSSIALYTTEFTSVEFRFGNPGAVQPPDPTREIIAYDARRTNTIAVVGMRPRVPYTFTATATNVEGTGAESAPSLPVVRDAPSAPSGVTATQLGPSQPVQVQFAAPAQSGVGVTGYRVRSIPHNIVFELSGGGSTTAFFTGEVAAAEMQPPDPNTPPATPGLSSGTAYQFVVQALSDAGPGVESAPSNVITPIFA